MRADAAGENNIDPVTTVGAMVRERDASSIQHLQKEIPDQVPDVGGSGGGVIFRKSFIGYCGQSGTRICSRTNRWR
jgi:hypothetical protein